MKRSLLAAALLSASILAGACGSTDSDTSSAAPTTTGTSATTTATSTVASPTTEVQEPESSVATAPSADEAYSFPGYRQACLEAITMLDQFDQLNKSWDPSSADLDRTSAVEELLAEVKTGAEFQAMSASEQDQFTKAFRSAATGHC